MPPLRRVPEEAGHWLLGSVRELSRSPHHFMHQTAARHGGIAQFRILRRRVVVVSDPELAQQTLVAGWERYARGLHNRNLGIVAGDGLLSTEGEIWRKRRRQTQPAFRRECLERLVPVAAESVEWILEEWEQRRQSGNSIPLGADMLRLAMRAMGRMLLSTDIAPEQGHRIGVILRDGLMLLRRRNTSLWPPPLWLPTSANRRLLAYRDELTEFVERHLDRRTAGVPAPSPDILARLLEVRDPDTGQPLTRQELIDETKTLFLAGFETTATALTWTLYLLARHPDAAAKARAEVDRVLENRTPAWDDLGRLSYVAMVLHEAMRLYPPVYAIARRCVADDDLGGFAIPRGTPVLVSIYGVHRSPAWGSDAEQFQPERFADRNWPKRAYMPFAAGQHLCIGNDFAMVEMSVALALILRRYRLALAENTRVGESPRITLVPDREIPLRLEAR
jgi:cytochrome P450